MAINYSSPGVPGGEVSPGSGSTGFTSNRLLFANSSGQVAANSSAPLWTESSHQFTVGNTTRSVELIGGQDVIRFSRDGAVRGGMSATTSEIMLVMGANPNFSSAATDNGRVFLSSVRFTVGTSDSGLIASFPSTVTRSTAIGVAGAAAALPATPESYLKVLAPNAAGTLTTLYVPLYLST